MNDAAMPDSVARPPTKAEQTRAAILAAAEDLFARQGYAATRLDDVAKAVGVKSAALFYHFRGKQALYDAVIEDAFGDLVARLDEAFSGPGGVTDRLEAGVEAWVDAIARRPTTARLILRQAAEAGDSPVKSPFPTERFVSVGWALFEEGRASGEIRPLHDDPFHAASALVGATVFYVSALASLLPPGEFDPLTADQIAVHKRDVLRSARNLFGIPTPSGDRLGRTE